MQEALNRYAEYMARQALEAAPEEAASIAKKPRKDNPHSKETSVPSTREIAVHEPVK